MTSFIDLDDAGKALTLREVADFFDGYTGSVRVSGHALEAFQGILRDRAAELEENLEPKVGDYVESLRAETPSWPVPPGTRGLLKEMRRPIMWLYRVEFHGYRSGTADNLWPLSRDEFKVLKGE